MPESNFAFLQSNRKFADIMKSASEAEATLASSPAACAILARRALELAVRWMYSAEPALHLPYQDNLSALIHEGTFMKLLDPRLFKPIKFTVRLGNSAAHAGTGITRGEAILSLRNIHQFLAWMDYRYSPEPVAFRPFNEQILPAPDEVQRSQAELHDLYELLGSHDRLLKEQVAANESLRAEIAALKASQGQAEPFHVDEISEFQTRKLYIDRDLKDAGWKFADDCIWELEVEGMPYGSGIGYADYVLFGGNGKPVAVVEAKRTCLDPRQGQQQAFIYADCLEKKYGQRPVIFYTNGFETHIWDNLRYPPRLVSGFHTKEELQLMINRRHNRLPLEHIGINKDITDRYYQREALLAVCESFEAGARKALLVMATGSGKTRTVASLVDILSRHEWITNVLFLADRRALVRQAKNAFNTHLPTMSLCNLTSNKDDPKSRIVFSTYPTIMNAIDGSKNEDGERLFSIGHFDLVVIDEAHRSIFKKYKAIFEYFDAMLVGLTATPKTDIDKNTYGIFDLENDVPTYAYELPNAVQDGFLVDHYRLETVLRFLDEGIVYDELSDEDKEAFEETFDDGMPDWIPSDALNKWIYNDDTIDKALSILMEKGLKVDGGDTLGKTIIFARNHEHAVHIVERFDILYPEYRGEFARVIDNAVNYAEDLIDRFSDKNQMPQIAVSVDMLDTGIDIPEILNLVFFKKVFSKSKFWQMIGRGTRLCKDLFGPDHDKECFYIFDLCGNFEFFRVNPKGREGKEAIGLTERIFGIKVDLIRELQDLRFQDEEHIAYRNQLIADCRADISALNREHFAIRQHLRYVDKYSQEQFWTAIGHIESEEIRSHLGPLIITIDGDELARRFDYLMLTIELAHIAAKNVRRQKDRVVTTAIGLSGKGTVPQVARQKDIIELVQTDEFWQTASIPDYEKVREALRELLKFLDKSDTKTYYTNFADELLEINESPGEYSVSNMESYYAKVNRYIAAHEDHIAIYKLKNNKRLNEQDYQTLESILWKELGSKEEYSQAFGATPLTLLVRKITGLSIEAANEAFAEYLDENSLNSRQIRFMKTIVDYVVKNGYIADKKVLQEDPFKTQGSILELFPTESAMKIVSIIDEIKKNAEELESA